MMYLVISIVLYLLVSRMLAVGEDGPMGQVIQPRVPEDLGQQEPSFRRL